MAFDHGDLFAIGMIVVMFGIFALLMGIIAACQHGIFTKCVCIYMPLSQWIFAGSLRESSIGPCNSFCGNWWQGASSL